MVVTGHVAVKVATQDCQEITRVTMDRILIPGKDTSCLRGGGRMGKKKTEGGYE